jgi:hypothetical protein
MVGRISPYLKGKSGKGEVVVLTGGLTPLSADARNRTAGRLALTVGNSGRYPSAILERVRNARFQAAALGVNAPQGDASRSTSHLSDRADC